MKKLLIIALFGLIVFAGLFAKRKYYDPKCQIENATKEVKKHSSQNAIKEGDIIFQTSLSQQSKAIQLATKSKYSHCGIIFKEGSDFIVLEAVQPVKTTPLNKWIARGEDGKYVIKRLKKC